MLATQDGDAAQDPGAEDDTAAAPVPADPGGASRPPAADATAPRAAAADPALSDPGAPEDGRPAGAKQAPRQEPKSPVRRRLESRQGHTYDAKFEKWPGRWELTIVQVPRQLGVDAPDFQDTFDDFWSAEAAFRAFVRDH
jgi:hypothetical protein